MYTRRVDSLFSHLNDKSHCENCDQTRVESCGRGFVHRQMHHRCITTLLFSARKRKKMNSLYELTVTMELTAP